jgi:hypothetical protein
VGSNLQVVGLATTGTLNVVGTSTTKDLIVTGTAQFLGTSKAQRALAVQDPKSFWSYTEDHKARRSTRGGIGLGAVRAVRTVFRNRWSGMNVLRCLARHDTVEFSHRPRRACTKKAG